MTDLPTKRRRRLGSPPLVALVLIAVAMAVTAGWWIWRAPEREHQASVQRGHELAQLLCARCHAVAGEPSSPLAEAPVFRDLTARLTVDGVEDMLAESLTLGHDPMPQWELSGGQIEDLLAYIVSLDADAL